MLKNVFLILTRFLKEKPLFIGLFIFFGEDGQEPAGGLW
jgi:hypothetical protein